MATDIPNGTRETRGGKDCVYYDGYWIRYYPTPKDSLSAKKRLITGLTRRLFHHTEPGINTPGDRLDAARRAYETAIDQRMKRVNGAMLAGALFNRATDIFTTVVDLAEKGVNISTDNELMKQCSEHFQEALELGGTVKHASGDEGIDELWGEPFRGFAIPVEEFFETRYLKIAQTFRDIDKVADTMMTVVANDPSFISVLAVIQCFADAAKIESETMRSDPCIFMVWPHFVASSERLFEFEPEVPADASEQRCRQIADGKRLIEDGRALLSYLASARVPMPKSTAVYLKKCQDYLVEYPPDAPIANPQAVEAPVERSAVK